MKHFGRSRLEKFAQQGGNHQSDDSQGAGDLENKLTGDFHYFAASFFSFLTAP